MEVENLRGSFNALYARATLVMRYTTKYITGRQQHRPQEQWRFMWRIDQGASWARDIGPYGGEFGVYAPGRHSDPHGLYVFLVSLPSRQVWRVPALTVNQLVVQDHERYLADPHHRDANPSAPIRHLHPWHPETWQALLPYLEQNPTAQAA